MISGVVNDSMEALVSLEILGPNGDERVIHAVVDTGYSGYLTLSRQIIAALGLPFVTTGVAQLADGSTVRFAIYNGTVIWDGRALLVELDEADTTPLIGMAMLTGHDLHIEIEVGGQVAIERRG